MAQIVGKPVIELKITLQLNEAEARALDALVGYGDEKFLAAFYEKLGEGYLKPHEAGLRELFKSCRQLLTPALDRVNDLRKLGQRIEQLSGV